MRLLLLLLPSTFLFLSCQSQPRELPAPGQPAMLELFHRSAAKRRDEVERAKAEMVRARTLTAEQVRSLLAGFRQNPVDGQTFRTLTEHYRHTGNFQALSDLYLWQIEHHPTAELRAARIDLPPDSSAYLRGKALWLAHTRRPGAPAEVYTRAADYLTAGDRPLAESILLDGQKAHPAHPGWPAALGRLYATALLDTDSPYAQSLRTRLAASADPQILAATAQFLLVLDRNRTVHPLASAYLDRALSLDPSSPRTQRVQTLRRERDGLVLYTAIRQLSPAEVDKRPEAERLIYHYYRTREYWQHPAEESAASARELLALVAAVPSDPIVADARYMANNALGKLAFHRGEIASAFSYLHASAKSSPSPTRVDMNLARALVDAGERTAVAEYLQRLAPKSQDPRQLETWAAEIRRGINPDLTPTFSYPACAHAPC